MNAQLLFVVAAALRFLSSFSEDELGYDAAVGMHYINQTCAIDPADHAAKHWLDLAYKNAMARAAMDNDHPSQRLWNSSFTACASSSSSLLSDLRTYKISSRRINPNRILLAALECAACTHNRRMHAEAVEYLCSGMRDNGGYQTTHAMWALVIARDNRCDVSAKCMRDIRDEILYFQRSQPPFFSSTLDVDLFAERLLMLALAHHPNATELQQWGAILASAQQPNGKFGVSSTPLGENLYYSYHSTFVSTWALCAVYK